MENLEKNRSWQDVLLALEYTHTISVRDICKSLKASRSWVNKYILPHIDKIYLNSNIRGSKKVPGINWVQIASVQLNRDYMKDSIWCNEEEFEQLIESSIVSKTIQTHNIPMELLVDDKKAYQAAYQALSNEINEAKDDLRKKASMERVTALSKALTEQKLCHLRLLNEAGKIVFAKDSVLPSVIKRKATSAYEYQGEVPGLKEWIAPHDIKEYGDTDESIYRYFFRNGYIRIELSVPDMESGEVGKKIYYFRNPENYDAAYVPEYITISEEMYQNVKEMLNYEDVERRG